MACRGDSTLLHHYPKTQQAQLATVAALAEDVHQRLTEVFPKTTYGKTQLVLTDHTDESNGFATVWPYPKITIYLAPLEDPRGFGLGKLEWLEYLLVHEYAHVLQLGAARGITGKLRKIFGSAIVPGSSFLLGFMRDGPRATSQAPAADCRLRSFAILCAMMTKRI